MTIGGSLASSVDKTVDKIDAVKKIGLISFQEIASKLDKVHPINTSSSDEIPYNVLKGEPDC